MRLPEMTGREWKQTLFPNDIYDTDSRRSQSSDGLFYHMFLRAVQYFSPYLPFDTVG